MKATTDMLTGKVFRWNTTVVVDGLRVPARITTRSFTHLHPDRVRPILLAKLNDPDRQVSC